MPRAFLVKKPCVSTCKRNWSELPDEERGEIYVPGEAPRVPGAGRAGRTDERSAPVSRAWGRSFSPRVDPRRSAGGGRGLQTEALPALRPGFSCPRRVTGDAAGCVTAQATSGSCVVNPENPGFHEAGEEHWSDATLEGRAGEWKGAELEFPLKLGLHCKRKLGALVGP